MNPYTFPRPLVIGVVNVTPDSFSDGGRHLDPDAAIAHGLALVADGADWIDVGGESTAPDRAPVAPEEEQRRILRVIAGLVAEGVRVSVDTYHASTAEAALAAGAGMVNDVYGSDPAMPAVVAGGGARYVLMHSYGEPTTPHRYDDIVAEVREELLRRAGALEAAGVAHDRIVLDPGLGFSKEPDENWTLLRESGELVATGYPVLIGTSRKRFVRRVVEAALTTAGAPDPVSEASITDRDLATAVTSAFALQAGAWAVRVHDVRATRIALEVAAAWTARAGAASAPAAALTGSRYPRSGTTEGRAR